LVDLFRTLSSLIRIPLISEALKSSAMISG